MSSNKKLEKIYFDLNSPGSLGGVEPLFSEAKKSNPEVKRAEIVEFLKGVPTYTLHKPYRRRYKRRKIIVGGIDKQWQADLADMNDVKIDNNGMRYLLTVIDCFSKFAWVEPILNKSAKSVRDAFEKIFKQAKPRKPIRIQTDKGKEFFNTDVSSLFKTLDIFHFASNSDQKAAIVERFNRTLKTKIWHYFTAKNTRTFIDVLPDLVNTYNKSYHRTIGMAPKDVKKSDELAIWQKAFKPSQNSEPVLNPNSKVRISKTKHVFEKGYLPNWTEEVFKVDSSETAHHPPIYKLKDMLEEPILGSFYKKEIQPVIEDEHPIYHIEKVLSKKRIRGIEHKLIKWKGFPNKFNSWVKTTDIINLPK